jgi:formate-dependent nitrite reductase membrane component NrfD
VSKTTTRYPRSVEPVSTDGRDINPELGRLTGEAGSQVSSGSTDVHIGSVAKAWNSLPEPQKEDPTYYDVPMLKEPVWEWAVPLYYYIGGLTGASLVLGAAAQITRPDEARTLIKRCHAIGFAGSVVSGGLLVYDLGKPSRFLNMLRVFRPTSPMNMGAWILSGTGATATGALLFAGRNGWLKLPGQLLGYAAGVFGAGLATYTGVLVANSAIPIWQESRRALPVLFGSSALASLGCTFDIFTENAEERRITNVIGNVGRVAEVVAGTLMEHHASAVPMVARPFSRGLSGVMWRTAELLTAASLLVSMAPNRNRRTRLAAGLLGTAGSLLLRYTVAHLGTVSARDSRASFHQQRAGRGAAEVSNVSEHVA